jgi:dipeptidyl aminopeptidase/acylaminoacyl peptidase
MFRKIIFACCAAFAMMGCDRIPQNSENILIPRSVLQAKPDKFRASMSHTGDKIAYLARNGSELELRVEDLSGNIIRKFAVKPARSLYHYVWAHTGDHILIAQDNNGDENNHVICLDIKTGESRDLTPFAGAKSEIGAVSAKFLDEIIVFSNKRDPQWFDAYRINVVTGKIDLVFKNTAKYGEAFFDNDFKLRLVARTMPDGSRDFYSMENGKPKFFKKILFEDAKNTAFTHFNSKGDTLYAIDSSNRDKSALVAYGLKSKTSRVLFESELADVEDFKCDPNTLVPQCVAVDYLKPEIFAIDEAVAKDIAYLKSKFEGKNFKIVSRNDNDNVWLISCHCSNSCAKYYLYRRDAKKREPISLKFLFSVQPTLDKYKLQEKIPVVIKSRDGLDLVCYLTKSIDFEKASPRKLIAYVHGGPWARDGDYCEPDVQLLANRGYSVLQVNYRGSTGFGKKFTNAGDGNVDKVRNDIIDGVNWAIENKIADKNYVAIMGASYGGYSVLAGLAFTPDTFCCGVDIVGPSNFITLLKTIPPYWISEITYFYKFFGDPNTKEGLKALIENSPITRAKDINKPLIIFQGKNDPRVNKGESDQIVAALKEKKLPVVYVLYPDEGHGFHRGQTLNPIWRLLKFS